MRRAVVVLAAGAAVLCAAPWSAAADDTVVVPGLGFTGMNTRLDSFGCTDLYHRDPAPARVSYVRDPGAPVGDQGFAIAGPAADTATGPVTLVASVAATTVAGVFGRSAQGSTGVAHVWYVAPGLEPGQVWWGRTQLTVPSAWTYLDTRAATYTWQLLEAATGATVREGGTADVAGFTAEHGDGPGYLLTGLGCDGADVSMDAIRVGAPGAVTTYDLEGLVLDTSVTASATRVQSGARVQLTGTTRDRNGVETGDTLVLEARRAGDSQFRRVGPPVLASPGALPRASVAPRRTTHYRWFRPATSYGDAGWSDTITVRVTAKH